MTSQQSCRPDEVFKNCIGCYKRHNSSTQVCGCSFCDCFEEACGGITILKEFLKW